MKSARLFYRSTFVFLLVLAGLSPAHGGEAVGGGTNTPVTYNESESVAASVAEFTKSRNKNLAELCGDCQYDADSRTTTCQKPGSHHLQRCEVVLWSQHTAGRKGYSECDEYLVGKNGHLSGAGQMIMDQIVKDVTDSGNDPANGFLRDNECLTQQQDERGRMMQICPHFKDFDYVKRMEFYLFLMENIAYRENSCRDKPKSVHGITTRAVCAFELEAPPKIRKQNRHGLASCQGSQAYIQTVDGCAKCATDMMFSSLEGLKNPDHSKCAPFGRAVGANVERMYWQALNPPVAGDHSKHEYQGLLSDLTWFPGCNNHPVGSTSSK